ncbi:putative cytochrome P450 304a1 [Augochlora pura]
MLLILILIILAIIGYKFYEFITCVPPNVPPCLPRVPFFGSYCFLLMGDYKYPFKTLRYYVKKLKSKVLTCYMGPYCTIVANDYNSIKEVYTSDALDGRPTEVDIVKSRAFGGYYGIFFTEGLFWKYQRRFALKNMRDFGFGRRQEKYEADMMEEVIQLIDTLKNGPINDQEKTILRKGAAYFNDVLYLYATNSIWNIMFGERFHRSDYHRTKGLCKNAMMFQRDSDTTGGAIFQHKFLKYFGNMFGFAGAIKGHYGMVDFVKEYLDTRKILHSEGNDTGMVDRYLTELQQQTDISSFSEKQLIMVLVDFMFPALSAMPSTLTQLIKTMLHYPEVAKKVQTEIDSVVGTGRIVNWDDRKNLPYTEATIRESMRFETLTPLGVYHKALRDTTLFGYDIPMNTLVIANLSGMNTDPDLWGDPENFRPERFLKEDGQLTKDLTLNFGFGHRVCAGETFARFNIFAVFAALMQNFDFGFIEGEPTGWDDKLPGLIVSPKETWIRVEPRC